MKPTTKREVIIVKPLTDRECALVHALGFSLRYVTDDAPIWADIHKALGDQLLYDCVRLSYSGWQHNIDRVPAPPKKRRKR